MALAWQTGIAALVCGGVLIAAHSEQEPPLRPYTAENHLADGEAPRPPAPTRVVSQRDAERLRALTGISLQWIGWDKPRGKVSTTIDKAGVWRIYGEQTGKAYEAVVVDGTITEIGPNYFTMEGAVAITNAPDEGRTCEGYGDWRFEITQNRKYYRLRQFEWCDELTDYIDLYF